MKIDFLWSQREKDKYFLALDFGTQVLKSLIFKREGEKIVILGAISETFEHPEMSDKQYFQPELIKKILTRVIQNSKNQAGVKKIEYILLGFSSNILKSRISIRNFNRNNPTEKIQEKEEGEITKKILAITRQEISHTISQEFGILPSDITFINSRILEIKNDGYNIPQLKGFSGQNLDFRIISTFLLKYYLGVIIKVLKDLNLKNIRIIQPAENLNVSIQDKKINGLFLDIGGSMTQILLLRDGEFQVMDEFPLGGEIFTQQLSEKLGITKAEAEDLKIRYSNRLLSEEVRSRIKEFLIAPTQSWFKNLNKKLKNSNISQSKGLLSSNIFLLGGGSQLLEIEDILANGNWDSQNFPSKPRVKIISPNDLKGIEDKTKKINNPQYVPPLLICYG